MRKLDSLENHVYLYETVACFVAVQGDVSSNFKSDLNVQCSDQSTLFLNLKSVGISLNCPFHEILLDGILPDGYWRWLEWPTCLNISQIFLAVRLTPKPKCENGRGRFNKT